MSAKRVSSQPARKIRRTSFSTPNAIPEQKEPLIYWRTLYQRIFNDGKDFFIWITYPKDLKSKGVVVHRDMDFFWVTIWLLEQFGQPSKLVSLLCDMLPTIVKRLEEKDAEMTQLEFGLLAFSLLTNLFPGLREAVSSRHATWGSWDPTEMEDGCTLEETSSEMRFYPVAVTEKALKALIVYRK